MMSVRDVPPIPTTTTTALLERYDGLLLDSYGVLTNSASALPGAHALIDRLRTDQVPFWVVTNDASRTPQTSSDRFRGLGLVIEADRIITSGSLIRAHYADHGLVGARTFVMGTSDTECYVRDAGGEVVPLAADARCDALVVGDDAGYPFLQTLDAALSMLYAHFDRGDDVALVLPNPDIVYPKAASSFGFTAGAVALLLEAALLRRFPERAPSFVRLGKPHSPMFEEAARRAGTRNLVMIGDQLETDIAGAVNYGIDAALLTTGVTRWDEARTDVRPTYVLECLAP